MSGYPTTNTTTTTVYSDALVSLLKYLVGLP